MVRPSQVYFIIMGFMALVITFLMTPAQYRPFNPTFLALPQPQYTTPPQPQHVSPQPASTTPAFAREPDNICERNGGVLIDGNCKPDPSTTCVMGAGPNNTNKCFPRTPAQPQTQSLILTGTQNVFSIPYGQSFTVDQFQLYFGKASPQKWSVRGINSGIVSVQNPDGSSTNAMPGDTRAVFRDSTVVCIQCPASLGTFITPH